MSKEDRMLAMINEPVIMAEIIMKLEERIKTLEEKLANITQ